MPNPKSTYVFKRVRVTTKNRMVLAAMTNKQSFDSGKISEAEIQWLVRRSEGGLGFLPQLQPIFQNVVRRGRVNLVFLIITLLNH